MFYACLLLQTLPVSLFESWCPSQHLQAFTRTFLFPFDRVVPIFLVVIVQSSGSRDHVVVQFQFFMQPLQRLCLFKSDMTLAVYGHPGSCCVHPGAFLVFFFLIVNTTLEQEKENKREAAVFQGTCVWKATLLQPSAWGSHIDGLFIIPPLLW